VGTARFACSSEKTAELGLNVALGHSAGRHRRHDKADMSTRPAFPLTKEAISYTWRELARRAGVATNQCTGTGFESLGVSVRYGIPEKPRVPERTLWVLPCGTDAPHELLQAPRDSLRWVPEQDAVPPGACLPVGNSVPVLLWGRGYEDGSRFAEVLEDGTIVFYADIVAASFLMLSRWEETVTYQVDEHERARPSASVAYRQGFLDRPIVDEYAALVGLRLRSVLPSWRPCHTGFRIFLSHDIDRPLLGMTWKGALLSAAKSMVTQRSPAGAARVMYEYVRTLANPKRDPYYAAFRDLMAVSEENGTRSTFHFMASEGGPFDVGYDPRKPPYRDMMLEAIARGHSVGFHPGYSTYLDADRFYEERARLAEVVGRSTFGGRQHYLRFRAPDTWRLWEAAGMSYDSTVGYADHVGFRCGTCHPFHPFDLSQDRQLDLWERPLVVMDTTLRARYRSSPGIAERLVLQLARRCCEVRGEFTLLWHNSVRHQDWRPSAPTYQRLVRKLAAMTRDCSI
jgi:hypothetical protein